MLALFAGCPDMDAYNKGTSTAPPPPADFDHCAQLCADAIMEGCDVKDCSVDAARDWGGELGVTIFTLAVDSDGGGSCDLVTDCSVSECTDLFQRCIDDGKTDCQAQWVICNSATTCGTELTGCDEQADDNLDWCHAHTPDEDCDGTWQSDRAMCQCYYDDCLTIGPMDCSDAGDLDRRAPPPAQTGPYAFTITRRLIDQQLARVTALEAETQPWAVPDATNTHWRGIRLPSIDPGQPLFAAGLRRDDVIRTVNGTPVIEAMRHPAQLLALRTAANIVVGVERAGVVHPFTYHVIP